MSNSTGLYATSTIIVCYRFGIIGLWFENVALTLGPAAWIALLAIAQRTQQVYMLAVIGYFTLAGVIYSTLRALFDETRPHVHCNGTSLNGMPAYEVYILYMYLAVSSVHSVWTPDAKITWKRLTSITVIAFIVPCILIVSGVYTLRQCVFSAIIGTALGLIFMLPMQSAWLGYCEVAARMPLMQATGWTHHVNDVYRCSIWAL